jgi:hypothetical protein
MLDHPRDCARASCQPGGIHGGETVVERQGTTEYENGLAPRDAGGQSIRL